MTRRDEIRARCEAATMGPWTLHGCDKHWKQGEKYCEAYYKVRGTRAGLKWQIADCRFVDAHEGCYDDKTAKGNADFIAHAREDIPWLLEQLERLERAKWMLDKIVYHDDISDHPHPGLMKEGRITLEEIADARE